MARSSSSRRWLRRTRVLIVIGTIVAATGAVRARMIASDQQQFDQRYPR